MSAGDADLGDLAAGHHRDAIRHGHRFFLVVRHVDEGNADLALDVAKLYLQLFAQLEVERPERLVEQEHRRAIHQGADEGNALLLAAGQLFGAAIPRPFQRDQAEHLLHTPLDLVRRNLLHSQAEADVLPDRHVREEGVVLEHGVDVASIGRVVGDALAVDEDLAAGHRNEPTDDVQRRGLAAARGSQQAEELAALDAQRNVIQGAHRPVELGHVAHFNGQIG